MNFLPEHPKHFDTNSVLILCPVIDLVSHSFNNNCKLEGVFMQNEAESFVVLRSVKDIEVGEEFTINYGNYSNHEFLMKFGFLNRVNEFNELPINLDFTDYL